MYFANAKFILIVNWPVLSSYQSSNCHFTLSFHWPLKTRFDITVWRWKKVWQSKWARTWYFEKQHLHRDCDPTLTLVRVSGHHKRVAPSSFSVNTSHRAASESFRRHIDILWVRIKIHVPTISPLKDFVTVCRSASVRLVGVEEVDLLFSIAVDITRRYSCQTYWKYTPSHMIN